MEALNSHTVRWMPVSFWVMTDDWTQLEEPHERLKWARKHAGFPTAKAAAESLGMQENTYSAYEREPGKSKNTPLDHQRAIQFARKFKVSWTWLLVREGTPFSQPFTSAQQRALEAMAGADDAEQMRAAEVVETMLKRA